MGFFGRFDSRLLSCFFLRHVTVPCQSLCPFHGFFLIGPPRHAPSFFSRKNLITFFYHFWQRKSGDGGCRICRLLDANDQQGVTLTSPLRQQMTFSAESILCWDRLDLFFDNQNSLLFFIAQPFAGELIQHTFFISICQPLLDF